MATQRHPRAPRHRSFARVEYGTPAVIRSGHLLDISSSGLFILSDAPTTVGSTLVLSIVVPTSPEPVCARARVVWNQRTDSTIHPAGMGLQFLELDAANRARLDAYLDTLD